MDNITDRNAAWAALHDPATDAATLAAIAMAHPEFGAQIAQHPNVYPELRAWAQGQTVPAPASPFATVWPIESAVAPAGRRPPAAPRAFSVAGRRWWWAVGVLILMEGVAGTVLVPILRATPLLEYQVALVTVVPLACLLVAAVVPIVAAAIAAQGSARRAVGIVLASLAAASLLVMVWIDLGVFGFNGLMEYGVFELLPLPGTTPRPIYLVIGIVWMTLLFSSWATTWPIRGLGYLGLVPLLLAAVVGYIFGDRGYDSSVLTVVFSVVLAVLIPVVAVLMAIGISRSVDRRRSPGAPVGTPPRRGVPGSAQTNVMAILSLVFAFVFSILGVVFGHVALSQIARTGEQGRGLAIAGLVIGYLSVVIGVLFVVYNIVVLGAIFSSGYNRYAD